MSEKTQSVLPILLKELRLPTMLRYWQDFSEKATLEGWPPTDYLRVLCEHEVENRTDRRLSRRITESKIPRGKSLESFDFSACQSLNKSHINALASGDAWIKSGMNLLIFGPSGVGKTHIAVAIAEQLLFNGFKVLFTRTTELVQKLQAAKQRLELSSFLGKLDKYDCLILDDFGYVKKDQLETNVLFELISERYERRSLIITCNQPFQEWDQIFEDKTMALAAVDRLVHHGTILEMNEQSYRKKTALNRCNSVGQKKEAEKKG